MTEKRALPADLLDLFTGDAGAGRSLSVALPPGRLVRHEEDDRPALWMSDEPAPAGLWARLRAEHARSGLWPVLLDALDDEAEEYRPWASGEVAPGDTTTIGAHDPAALLAGWWAEHTAEEAPTTTSPFGRQWPGLAAVPATTGDPDRVADDLADHLLAGHPSMRLGLVAADRGADTPAALEWGGPTNYMDDPAKLSAVLRDWADRFGARVVGIGFDTLVLAVAAPPTTHTDALAVAAEHFALAPDNVWQSEPPNTLAAYAQHLVGDHSWTFWWD
ncbi:DUF4253 domain-containing protein [Actinokineospora diospyrosa]|uniref:DUF4253 domain-containing protein n=1 Tax=Actinokineospora diospyrosa TaxID=103728 RepID=UPI0020A479FC|nr:DUF4253 domain-containing protein [Actinokineospora diospyrosa]